MRTVLFQLWLLLFLALAACSAPSRLGREQSDQELYRTAEQAFARKKYAVAQRQLQQLLRQHPESAFGPSARLLLGRAYLLDKNYEEARAEYLKFLDLFPQHERADEAYYFMGLSYFEQMNGLDRDQTFTRQALENFQVLLTQMPDSRYVGEARVRARVCRRRLAAKELYVGRFYFRRGHYTAALGRLTTVLTEYRGMGMEEEALFYTGEALWRLEQRGQAGEVFRRFLARYPRSAWAKVAAKRLEILGPVASEEKPKGGLAGKSKALLPGPAKTPPGQKVKGSRKQGTRASQSPRQGTALKVPTRPELGRERGMDTSSVPTIQEQKGKEQVVRRVDVPTTPEMPRVREELELGAERPRAPLALSERRGPGRLLTDEELDQVTAAGNPPLRRQLDSTKDEHERAKEEYERARAKYEMTRKRMTERLQALEAERQTPAGSLSDWQGKTGSEPSETGEVVSKPPS